ncbi:MAG: NAD(P)-dependent alcohol dehydrogenase [Candidatus Thorarchaeota archaeon]|nr:MAG: NAD(P)-dependent alcohol dehydrogenase [Candidatus Thorarchaeota archaeon]
MKAIVCPKYGRPEVLQLKEVDKPAPKNNEVLIRIIRATVTAGDCEVRRFDFPSWLWLLARLGFGIRGPRQQILGQELAGEIEAVGEDVTRFKPGDQVFGSTGFGLGAYAEYNCVPELGDGAIVLKPSNLTFDEVAVIPTGGITAIHFLRKGNIQGGQKVLINGAGGSIGTISVQLVKHWGAEVTAVDSAQKLDMLRSIGADHVIDYTKEDFSDRGETYDVIFDVVGKAAWLSVTKSLTENGIYLCGYPTVSRSLRGRLMAWRSNRTYIGGSASDNIEDLEYLAELFEAGTIKSVIDRSYPLEEMVDAHRYVESGQKIGNVVVTVE